jgi:hypothetical protein
MASSSFTPSLTHAQLGHSCTRNHPLTLGISSPSHHGEGLWKPPSSRDGGVECRLLLRIFCVPFGGAPTGASLHLRLPLQRRRPRRRALRLRRLRPALPASSPMCAPETCNWASDADCDYGGPGSGSARPGPTACGTGPSSYVVTKVTQLCVHELN